jgi:hypothetical protein
VNDHFRLGGTRLPKNDIISVAPWRDHCDVHCGEFQLGTQSRRPGCKGTRWTVKVASRGVGIDCSQGSGNIFIESPGFADRRSAESSRDALWFFGGEQSPLWRRCREANIAIQYSAMPAVRNTSLLRAIRIGKCYGKSGPSRSQLRGELRYTTRRDQSRTCTAHQDAYSVPESWCICIVSFSGIPIVSTVTKLRAAILAQR